VDFFDQAHKWLVEKYDADRIITAKAAKLQHQKEQRQQRRSQGRGFSR